MNAARTDATVKMDQYPNLRLVLKSFTKTPATVGNSGEIYIRYYLKDILTNQSTKAKSVNIRIEALKNWDQTKYEITDAWSNKSGELLADLVNMDKVSAEVAVKNWVTNLINNPNISVVEIKDFAFTASSSSAKGSVAGTVVLKDASNAEAASPEVVLTAKEIEKRETAENTKARVETAITKELTLSDKTTANDVLNFVKANIKNPDITADWSTNEGEEFKLIAPTLISDGSIAGIIELKDTNEHAAAPITADVDVAKVIQRLPQTTLEDAKTAATLSLDKLVAANDSKIANKSSVLDEVKGNISLTGAKVEYKKDDKGADLFEGTNATAVDKDGKLACTIVITNDEGDSIEVVYDAVVKYTK